MKYFLLAALLCAPSASLRAQVQVGAAANTAGISQGAGASGAAVSAAEGPGGLALSLTASPGGTLLVPSLNSIGNPDPALRSAARTVTKASPLSTAEALLLPAPLTASPVTANRQSQEIPAIGKQLMPSAQAKTKGPGFSSLQPSVNENAEKGAGVAKTQAPGIAALSGRQLFDGGRTRSEGNFAQPEERGENADIPQLSRHAGQRAPKDNTVNEPAAPPSKELEPSSMPFWKRAAVVAGILGGLAAFPPLLSAELLKSVAQVVIPGIGAQGGLGMFAIGTAILANPLAWIAAAAITLLGMKLRLTAYRMFPAELKGGKNEQNKMIRQPLWWVAPKLIFGAAMEEYLFRGLLFGLSFIFLSPLMGAPLAFITASLGSSLIFALAHGYGSLWTRVVGGMIYTAVFALTGSLIYAAALHFLHNLRIYLVERRRLKRA